MVEVIMHMVDRQEQTHICNHWHHIVGKKNQLIYSSPNDFQMMEYDFNSLSVMKQNNTFNDAVTYVIYQRDDGGVGLLRVA